mmetsp:Transcript_373/g.943  ORF Transcript_373/g.943 Transcript_373/m.943 type:complete len:308 (-) Transcript_373:159-1082(-)
MTTTSYLSGNSFLISASTLVNTSSTSPLRFPLKSIPPMMSSLATISVTQKVSAPKTRSLMTLQSSRLTEFSISSGLSRSTSFSNSFLSDSSEDLSPPCFTSFTIFAICSAADFTFAASSSSSSFPPSLVDAFPSPPAPLPSRSWMSLSAAFPVLVSTCAIFARISGLNSTLRGSSRGLSASASSSSTPRIASRSESVRFRDRSSGALAAAGDPEAEAPPSSPLEGAVALWRSSFPSSSKTRTTAHRCCRRPPARVRPTRFRAEQPFTMDEALLVVLVLLLVLVLGGTTLDVPAWVHRSVLLWLAPAR